MKLWLVLLCLLYACSAWAQEQQRERQKWICVADAAQGFSFNNFSNSWQGGSFNAKSRFVIRYALPTERQTHKNTEILVIEISENVASGFCPTDFIDDSIRCRMIGGAFIFNRKTMRYMHIYELGYTAPWEKEGADTPFMEIGRCSAL